MISSVIFDFDGVLGLSRSLAWAAGSRILAAFGRKVSPTTVREYRQTFGREAQAAAAGADGAETLREMHRLVMRAQGAAIPRHEALLAKVARLRCPVAVITAGYATTVERCLGEFAARMRFIRGWEHGAKGDLLARCREGDFRQPLYVSDTVRDIRRCQATGVAVCATAWSHAYDEPADLAAVGPDWLVRDLAELAALFISLHLSNEN